MSQFLAGEWCSWLLGTLGLVCSRRHVEVARVSTLYLARPPPCCILWPRHHLSVHINRVTTSTQHANKVNSLKTRMSTIVALTPCFSMQGAWVQLSRFTLMTLIGVGVLAEEEGQSQRLQTARLLQNRYGVCVFAPDRSTNMATAVASCTKRIISTSLTISGSLR